VQSTRTANLTAIVVVQLVFPLGAVLFGRLLGVALLRGTHRQAVGAL
jgi:hypothetical protein